MTDIAQLVEKKNAWLASQVDVEYPTKESLQGRDLYLSRQQTAHAVEYKNPLHPDDIEMEIYVIDFHRLTIMFAMLQAKFWQAESEQSLIVEFLTQIIFDENHPMYIAFAEGEPCACALTTPGDGIVLISDLWSLDPAHEAAFIAQLFDRIKLETQIDAPIWVEFID
ncbi:flavodoxin [Vibrio sp. SCSIO 43136]|uniref:flavodoxin n=1 Tax=Vibrio sp. SCSIO 43136 TaxID=2819101 RepID=UPI002074F3A4|nr:flavodoxin [Vibrio sp. SCSIO 43136]USD66974.1 flavodoxin [Vibrio sp. SCSIO 43136]